MCSGYRHLSTSEVSRWIAKVNGGLETGPYARGFWGSTPFPPQRTEKIKNSIKMSEKKEEIKKIKVSITNDDRGEDFFFTHQNYLRISVLHITLMEVLSQIWQSIQNLLQKTKKSVHQQDYNLYSQAWFWHFPINQSINQWVYYHIGLSA